MSKSSPIDFSIFSLHYFLIYPLVNSRLLARFVSLRGKFLSHILCQPKVLWSRWYSSQLDYIFYPNLLAISSCDISASSLLSSIAALLAAIIASISAFIPIKKKICSKCFVEMSSEFEAQFIVRSS